MIEELPFFPDRPAFTYQVPLDGVVYGLLFEYSEPRASWYVTMTTAAGVVVYRRQRLTPGADLGRALSGLAPPGRLSCVGADPYARDELSIVYVPEGFDLTTLEEAAAADFQVRLA